MPAPKPVASTLTVTCGATPAASLAPLCGEIESHRPESSVFADAVQLIVPVPVLTTPKDCAGITPPCATAVKLMPACVRSTACARLLTVIVTGIVTADPESGCTAIEPV